MKMIIEVPEEEAAMFLLLCPDERDRSYWLRRRIERCFTQTMINLAKTGRLERLQDYKDLKALFSPNFEEVTND